MDMLCNCNVQRHSHLAAPAAAMNCWILSVKNAAAVNEDEDGGKHNPTGGSGNQEGGVGPWKLDPSEMSHDNVLLLLLLLLLLLSRSYFQQLRRMAIEAVALLQAGASSCTRHNPEIEMQNFSSSLPSGPPV